MRVFARTAPATVMIAASIVTGLGLAGTAMATSANADTTLISTSNTYDGGAAAQWALNHAQDPQPFPASCTWFASQALWAAGLAQTPDWTSDGEHGRFQKRPGTVSATAAPDLIRYLQAAYPASNMEQISFSGNAVPDAVPGDLILYDWDDSAGDGSDPVTNIDHIAVVTSIEPGSYPDVAEWGTYDAGASSPYDQRGWTYSAKYGKWLQVDSPHVVAYLFHINTGTPATY